MAKGYELTPEEQAALDRLKADSARRDEILKTGQGFAVSHPDKYAFPIGLPDDDPDATIEEPPRRGRGRQKT